MASVYWDCSSKGANKNLTHTKYHNCWRAEVMINRVRYRKRFQSYEDAVHWASNLKLEGIKNQTKVSNEIPKELQESVSKLGKLKTIIKKKSK